MAAAFSATKGPPARTPCPCRARATSSLPVPDSPVISTVTLDCASRPMARNTSCIAVDEDCVIIQRSLFCADSPCPSGLSGCADSCIARWISATASFTSNGLAR
ncbi:hypothetical protein D9M68_764220 [compost metagenome]